MCEIDLVLLLLLLIFCNILLSYSLVLIRTITATGIPVRRNIAVDECMCRFTGRAKEKLTIANKPIPTGIKAWIIIDKGFFYYWFWYAKGNGP